MNKVILAVAAVLVIACSGCNESQKLTDEARMGIYLKLPADSNDYAKWTGRFGDSAESWELFNMRFLLRYANAAHKRLNALEKELAEMKVTPAAVPATDRKAEQIIEKDAIINNQ